MRTMSSVEFNIVRLQRIEQAQQDNLTYCDILNPAKTMDVYYHRYDRVYVQDQIYTHSGVMSLNRLGKYIGRHFNYIDIDTDFEDISALIQLIKQQAIPELPILIYLTSWKLFLLPIEVLKALKTAGIYVLLDECYESYVDHLYGYFTWATMCGLKDLNNIRIISGRYNGHPRLKQDDLQWIDLDLDMLGIRVISFPYFWFHYAAEESFQEYRDKEINFDKPTGSVLCMNNWLRQHRLLMLLRLLYEGTLDKISWSAIDSNWEMLLDSKLSHQEFNVAELGVDTWVTASLIEDFKTKLPKYLDLDDKSEEKQILSNKDTTDLHDSHLVNLVNETAYGTGPWDPYGINTIPEFSDNSRLDYNTRNLHRRYGFITEKTYKAIVTGQMFIVNGSANSLTYLRKLGFKTFNQYFDESYDFELDDSKRYIKVCDTVSTIMNTHYNLKDDTVLQEILEHNKQHFFDLSALTSQAYNLVEFLRETTVNNNY